MTLQELNRMLDTIPNVGHVYGNFPENQEVPYIAYQANEDSQIYSDGKLIYSESQITFNLVTRLRDLSAENFIDNMLSRCGLQFAKRYEIDSEQKTHTTIYEFMI